MRCSEVKNMYSTLQTVGLGSGDLGGLPLSVILESLQCLLSRARRWEKATRRARLEGQASLEPSSRRFRRSWTWSQRKLYFRLEFRA